eukprot:TRINITY_DN6920_c3_g1_i1.p1 TRINITY_DN6920_c3_g1~~TRINITY_DN6920_c3_g1_i1.p1  ORF type:complete len:523 (+),score=69.98 TRINITY_DN6920_c3_g1_i1:141-1571(+)
MVCSEYSQSYQINAEVIYNGVHFKTENLGDLTELRQKVRQRHGIEVAAPMFLFLGQFVAQKGPELLLEALPFVLQVWSNARFVFAGTGGPMKTVLEQRCEELGIAHAVSFVRTSRTSHEPEALLSACDAVVIPSRSDTNGLNVLESWSFGKPVVASRCASHIEIVQHDKDGYLVDQNASSIAWGVCEICQNLDHAKWMGMQARNRARHEFSWTSIASQIEKVYFEVLALQGAPRKHGEVSRKPLAASLLRGPTKDLTSLPGFAVFKMLKLLAFGLGSKATITWMGSDFGYPKAVDWRRRLVGREVCIPYDEADNKGLPFKYISMLQMWLLRLDRNLDFLSIPMKASEPELRPIKDSGGSTEDDQVIIFSRGGCVFLMNFHPAAAVEDLLVDFPTTSPLDINRFGYVVALDTNSSKFGGQGDSLPKPIIVGSSLQLPVLPPRRGLVLVPAAAFARALQNDFLLRLDSADDFIDQLSL